MRLIAAARSLKNCATMLWNRKKKLHQTRQTDWQQRRCRCKALSFKCQVIRTLIMWKFKKGFWWLTWFIIFTHSHFTEKYWATMLRNRKKKLHQARQTDWQQRRRCCNALSFKCHVTNTLLNCYWDFNALAQQGQDETEVDRPSTLKTLLALYNGVKFFVNAY